MADTLRKFLFDLNVDDGLAAIGYSKADIPALVKGTLPQVRQRAKQFFLSNKIEQILAKTEVLLFQQVLFLFLHENCLNGENYGWSIVFCFTPQLRFFFSVGWSACCNFHMDPEKRAKCLVLGFSNVTVFKKRMFSIDL